MIDFRCACGAKIRVPTEAAGRRGTCRTCGDKFTVPLFGEEQLALAPEAPTRASPASPVILPPAPIRQSHYNTPSRVAFEDARRSRRSTSYWMDALRSFQTPVSPHGVAVILSIVALLILCGFAPGMLGLLGALISYGVLFAYCFDVITETAGGEDQLPLPTGIEEWWEILPGAVISMLTTFGFFAIIPVIVVVSLALTGASQDAIIRAGTIAGAVSAFLVPVALLAVAMGGVSVLIRLDLLLRTIIAAPLQYLALWAMLLLAAAILVGLAGVIASAGAPSGIGGTLLANVVAGVVSVYFLIVCSRQIGLFYRHFSDRFPWTAG